MTTDGLDKDVRQWVRKARKAGWEVTMTGTSHLRFMPPDGGSWVTVSNSGSNKARRLMNSRAELRRKGLDV